MVGTVWFILRDNRPVFDTYTQFGIFRIVNINRRFFMRFFIFLVIVVACMFACQPVQPAETDVNSLYSPSTAFLVKPIQDDGTVLRVIAVDSLTFTGIIVQTPNDVLCDTVAGYKSEWVQCKTCTDGCM